MFESYPTGPQNKDRVFKKGNQVTVRSLRSANKNGVLVNMGNVDTHTERTPHENRPNLLQAEEHQGLTTATRSRGQACDRFSESPGGTHPDNTPILDFQPPELGDNTFLVLKPPSLGQFVKAAQGKSHRRQDTWWGRQRWGRALGCTTSRNLLQTAGEGWGGGLLGYPVPEPPEVPGAAADISVLREEHHGMITRAPHLSLTNYLI